MAKFSIWVHPKGYADFDSHYVTVEAANAGEASAKVLREKKLYYAGCIGHVREIVPPPPALSKEEQEYYANAFKGDNS